MPVVTSPEVVSSPSLVHDPLQVVLEKSVFADRVAELPIAGFDGRSVSRDARFTSDDVAESLRQQGFTRMWMSSHFGGANASLAEGIAVVSTLAEVDGSIGWQIGVQGAIGRISDYLPVHSAVQLFADNVDFVIGSVNPTGRYVAGDDGDFKVTGRWSFASGERHARWFVCAATADPVSATNDGIRMFFVPRHAVTVHDVWHTMGLRRTGSNDYSLDDVLVPGAMSVRQSDMFSAPPDRVERGYPISYYDFGPFTSSGTMLGLARAALREFKSTAAARVRAASSAPISLSHTAQDAVGRAEIAYVQAATLLLHTASLAGEDTTLDADELSALVRLTAASVADLCTSIVGTMFRVAGTGALYETSTLEQYFRDAHTASKHITLSPTNFEMAGQFLLGGPLEMRR